MLSISDIIEFSKGKTITSYNTNINNRIIEIIKLFCIDNNIILDYDNNSINFVFNLYSISPFKHSNNLSNILYNHISKFIVLHTRIENKELSISVNNEKIIFIKLLFIPSITLLDKFNISYNNNSLILIPYLINIYLEIQKKTEINNLLENDIINNDIFKQIILHPKKRIILYNQDNIRNDIIKQLYHFLKKYEIIFLDYYGLNQNIENFNKTLQIIYKINIITDIKNKLIEILKILNISGDIIINSDRTYMINNFRLKKTLIYISIYNQKYKSFNKINIINCFNELSYNILPVLTDNTTITHPYVLLKYVIMNLIFIKIYSDTKHPSYLENIEYIKKILLYNIDIKKYKFIGFYKNEELDLSMYNVYRPYQYFLKYDTLRII